MLTFADEYEIKDLETRSHAFLKIKLSECEKGDKALLNISRIASKCRIEFLLATCIIRCAEELNREELESSFSDLRNEIIAALIIRKSASEQK